MSLINSKTTHYVSENRRLLVENEYIKHSHDTIMKSFQDRLDSFGNSLVANLHSHTATSSYTQWKLIEEKLDEQARRVENFVDMQTAQSRMIGTVISGTYSIPTLCIVLPKVNKGLARLNPLNVHIITDEYRMFFICSHTLRVVPCGPKGKGYKFSETKQWVKRAAPVLKVGLILLKLGLLATTGLSLPIPGLEDIVDNKNSISFIDSSLQVMDGAIDLTSSSTLTVEQHLHSLTRDDAEIRSAYEAIKSLLTDPSKGLDKQLLHLQMIQQTCTETGITAWIRNEDTVIQSFKDNQGRRVTRTP